MANAECLQFLEKGVELWNHWRSENPDIQPDLTRISLIGNDLRGINLQGVNLREANLSRSNLSGANLVNANLREANLVRTNLSHAALINANLVHANLIRSNLSRADLSGANLIEADLINADLVDANLFGANLKEVNLSGATLHGANLRNVNAINARFNGAVLTGACIEAWTVNTTLVDVKCDFVFLKWNADRREFTDRRPLDTQCHFTPGDLEKLVLDTQETIDLVFSEGIDWYAFLNTFHNIQTRWGNISLSLRTIEQRSQELVIRLAIPSQLGKTIVEKLFNQWYLQELENQEIRQTKQGLSSAEIQYQRQQNASILGLIQQSLAAGVEVPGLKYPKTKEIA